MDVFAELKALLTSDPANTDKLATTFETAIQAAPPQTIRAYQESICTRALRERLRITSCAEGDWMQVAEGVKALRPDKTFKTTDGSRCKGRKTTKIVPDIVLQFDDKAILVLEVKVLRAQNDGEFLQLNGPVNEQTRWTTWATVEEFQRHVEENQLRKYVQAVAQCYRAPTFGYVVTVIRKDVGPESLLNGFDGCRVVISSRAVLPVG